jgi:hypothetical protein
MGIEKHATISHYMAEAHAWALSTAIEFGVANVSLALNLTE